jgi:hypothetical protein
VQNLEKCQFLKDKINFVGHEISPSGVAPVPSKLRQIYEVNLPKTLKQLKSFLGMCSWLRRFVPHFSSIAAPLYKIMTTSETNKINWNETSLQGFDNLKNAMAQISLLRHPNPLKRLYLQTDSSFTGVGTVLFQITDKNKIQILQFASRLLKGPERNYSANEVKAVAILFALSKWQVYLLGRRFTIRTDNHALVFLDSCRPSNSRLVRFAL